MKIQLRYYLFLTALLVTLADPVQAADITVDGVCTLADAITAANNDADAGNCVASGAYGNDTITLQTDVTLAAALPEIKSTIIIEGGGHFISGNNDENVGSVLRITDGGNLTLNDATVTGGHSKHGGGIYIASGTVTLNNSTVSENLGGSSGGGIYVIRSSVTLTDSTINKNGATVGGGLYVSSCVLTLNNSTVLENWAGFPGGGIYATESSIVTLTDSTISGNGGEYGAGIEAHSSTITLNSSTVSGNEALWGGGIRARTSSTITLNDSTVSENRAMSGGGILVYEGNSVTLNNSTITQNDASAGGGGGIGAYGTVILTNSTISNNEAFPHGGGIYIGDTGTVTLTNCTVSGNEAEKGGGIHASGTVTLTNSTVSENSANNKGGGIYTTDAGLVALNSALISGNTAYSGNEIYNNDSLIYADSFNLFGHSGESDAEAFVGFTPGGNDINATSDGTNTPLTSILDTTLADNGGPTLTHALPEGSLAIDRDPSCNDGLIAIDQRGYPRPSGNGCDAGAFEFTQNLNTVTETLLKAGTAVNELDTAVFKGKKKKAKKRRKQLARKISRALELADKGKYLRALKILRNAVLKRIDGCAASGQPDRNDWIQDCDAQEQVYPLIMKSAEYLKEIL